MILMDQLIVEHQDYVEKLQTLAEVIQGLRVNGRGNYFMETLEGLLPVFTTDLDRHAGREEDFLFPRIVERVNDSLVPVMLTEHEAIRQASRDFEKGYRLWHQGDDAAFEGWVNAAAALRGSFVTHMQKENLILFPLARRILTPDEQARLTTWNDG